MQIWIKLETNSAGSARDSLRNLSWCCQSTERASPSGTSEIFWIQMSDSSVKSITSDPVVQSSVPRFSSRNRARYAIWNPIPCSNQPHPPTSAQSQNPCGGLPALLEHPLCCSKLPETLHVRFHKEKCQHVKGSSECQSDQRKSASMQLQVVAKGLGYLHHQAGCHSAAISKLCCKCSLSPSRSQLQPQKWWPTPQPRSAPRVQLFQWFVASQGHNHDLCYPHWWH